MTLSPFHLAFPVHDLAAARAFWGGVMGCPEGRSSAAWTDFDFYGHQIVTHLVPGCDQRDEASNPVDGHGVPGGLLTAAALGRRVRARAGIASPALSNLGRTTAQPETSD